MLYSQVEVKPYWAELIGLDASYFLHKIERTNDGGFVLAGERNVSGAKDICIIKLNSDGEIEWQNVYSYSGNEYANSIQQTKDGYYIVAGYTTGSYQNTDAIVIKLDSLGELEWAKIYGKSGNDWANSIKETSDGYIFVGQMMNDSGSIDALIVKISVDGVTEWRKIYGGQYSDIAYDIEVINEGDSEEYVIVGSSEFPGLTWSSWILKLDKEGNMLTDKYYINGYNNEINRIIKTEDGGFILAGSTNATMSGSDMWIIKTDNGGNIQWQRRYGQPYSDEKAYSIIKTIDAGYAVIGFTGVFSTFNSIYLVKINSYGEVQWEKSYYSYTGNSFGRDIIQLEDGSYVIGGYLGSVAGSSNIWIMKTNENGNIDKACNFIFDVNLEDQVTNAYINSSILIMDTVYVEGVNIGIEKISAGAVVHQQCSCQLAIEAIEPSYGCITGGKEVNIYGKYFLEPMEVLFNYYKSPQIKINSENMITAITPMHSPGIVDVSVRRSCTKDIKITATLESSFEFLLKPIITDITPNGVDNRIENEITIKGYNFSSRSKVYFHAEVEGIIYKEYSSQLSFISSNEIIAKTPKDFPVSVANVCIENEDCAEVCNYQGLGFYNSHTNMPFVPHIGTTSGGTIVNIYGSKYIMDGVQKVLFNGVNARIKEIENNRIKVISPTHNEEDVTITVCGIFFPYPCIALPNIYEYATLGVVTGAKKDIKIIDTTRDKLVDLEYYNPGIQSEVKLNNVPSSADFSKNKRIPGRYIYVPVIRELGLEVLKIHSGTFEIVDWYASPYEIIQPSDVKVAEFNSTTNAGTAINHIIVGANGWLFHGYKGGVVVLDADTMDEVQTIPIPSLSLGQVLNVSAVNDKVFLSSIKGYGEGEIQYLVTLKYNKDSSQWVIWCEQDGNQLPNITSQSVVNIGIDSFYDEESGKERVCIVAPEYSFIEAPGYKQGALLCSNPCEEFDQIIKLDAYNIETFPQDVTIGKITDPETGETDWKAFVADSKTNNWTRIDGLLSDTPSPSFPIYDTNGTTPVACEIRSNYDKVYFVNMFSSDSPAEESDISVIKPLNNRVGAEIKGIAVGYEPSSMAIQKVIEIKDFIDAAKETIEVMPEEDFTNPNKRKILINKLEVIEQLINLPANEQAVISNIEVFKNQIDNFVINPDKKDELTSYADALIDSMI